MAHATINRAHAFSTGSPLWIIPSPTAETPLLRRIDWYLNFQLSRARTHQSRTLDASLKDILTKNHLESLFTVNGPANLPAPLAVIADEHLPANIVVELPPSNPQNWVQAAHSVWTEFGKPNVRVFLPQKIDPDFFAKYWPNAPTDEVSLVPL